MGLMQHSRQKRYMKKAWIIVNTVEPTIERNNHDDQARRKSLIATHSVMPVLGVLDGSPTNPASHSRPEPHLPWKLGSSGGVARRVNLSGANRGLLIKPREASLGLGKVPEGWVVLPGGR